jgi:CPA2 family monovalent cation:H+ antiporter-2
VAAFKKYLDQNEIDVSPLETESDIVLQQLELINEAFIGKSIRDSELREKTHGLIVGLERGGKRILNPESKLILEKNDILWIVGSKKLLANLSKN